MMRKGGNIYLLIGLLLLFLVIDIGQATWALTPPRTRKYVVQPGETLADIADRYQVHAQVIMQASGLRPGTPVEAGQVLSIPLSLLAPLRQWNVLWVGLAGTGVGVLISFWLAHLAGLLPKGFRARILVISLTLSIVSYAILQTMSSEVPATVTPLLVFAAVKDGFAWGISVPLLAKAIGFWPVSP